ncbi:MAG: TetR/AcrR family transcriptional regulator [Pseudomonadota bacterium]
MPIAAPPPASPPAAAEPTDVRARILDTASRLFYARGVRAVGVDLVILEAGVAKTSLYRHFRTKDELIVAFLEREEVEFWGLWDEVAAAHAGDPMGELRAQLGWVSERLGRENYRGCPQINVAAEFAEPEHPARAVARLHMQRLRERLHRIAAALGAARPGELAAQLSLLVNGAFVSPALLAPGEAGTVLQAAARALVAAAR